MACRGMNADAQWPQTITGASGGGAVAMILEHGRPQYLSNRTRLASAGIFAYGPEAAHSSR